ncbi:hypothetical protein ACQKP8_26950 [Photobacterium alginatilyticum]|uniref:hypothetical protein n=1 Tax=Photobacterium alginatilyticum TaxID=1775171 RepID=UPI0040682A8B
MLKRQLVMFVFLMIAMPVLAVTPRMKLNHSWMNDNYQSIESILKHGEELSVIPVLNTLIDIWLNRDGGVSGEVTPLIVIALINNAEPTLILLSEHPDSFERWLNELDGMVFTDHAGTESEKLNKIKYHVLESMEAYSKNGRQELTIYAEQLIERIEHISVRTVH